MEIAFSFAFSSGLLIKIWLLVYSPTPYKISIFTVIEKGVERSIFLMYRNWWALWLKENEGDSWQQTQG